ncbi:MAG: helix-turn-helix transcriptional regulator [Xanthomonadales bacterium]|nr:helix-turn-helix transcriptional regulator [Gammaproteobacteria bacterium]MBT8055892.1 helix-turn-helix transcriptional regulator [Gammaproteobacteria bacterium]NNJ78188.1 helix-turn-helix transcriptional regulator [Xanthomonadales bacterium]NNL04309.1 helix-turn-helix transcriptional regulator [Xanthomonadales bacterium]
MGQTRELVATLKAALKAQGKTYADVARALDLTEASVKRIFSQQNFSLHRLDRVCQMLGMDISDLVQLMNERRQQLQQLTWEQEEELTADVTLMLVAVCVLNRWTLDEILDYYRISEHECIRHLARLDRLKLIELLPKNRIRLLVAPNFSWIDDGPIQHFFQKKIGQEFFHTRFNRDDECLVVLNGMLSSQSNGEMQRKLRRLASEFDSLNNDDAALDLDQRQGATLVLALRDWRYGLFRPIIRP